MSETAKKNAMRGAKAPVPKPEPAPEENTTLASEDEAVDEEPAPAPEPAREYPKGVEVLDDGTWLYSLQHEPRMLPKVKDGKIIEEKDEVSLPFKVRIPKDVWAKNIREASRDADNEGEVLFYLSCSMTHTAPATMDRFDARDYSVISARVNDVLQHRTTRPGNT